MRRNWNSIWLLLLLALSACYSPLVSPDNSVLSGTPCTPPCWQNLTPGKATADDVERFVDKLSLVERTRLSVQTGPSERKTFMWDSPRSGSSRAIELDKGRVILITLGTPEFDLRLETVVEHFGAPQYVVALLSGVTHGGWYTIDVYYPNRGIVFECGPDLQDLGQIKPDVKITASYYFIPGDLENYFSARGWTAKYIDTVMSNLQPWPGFGPIRVPTAAP